MEGNEPVAAEGPGTHFLWQKGSKTSQEALNPQDLGKELRKVVPAPEGFSN